MLSFIVLPSTAPTDLFAATGALLSDIWGIIALAIGIPLAFFLMEIIINLIRPEQKEKHFGEFLE